MTEGATTGAAVETEEIDMNTRQTLVAMAAVAMLASTAVALAQTGTVDKAYEDGKAAEISSARLRLATRPAAAGIQELNEAEEALRRLKAAKDAETRRKIAAELDLAVTRLTIVANGHVDERRER